MRIGILQCDHVRDELRPSFGEYPEMLMKRFHERVTDWQFVTYAVVDGHFPERADECDAYITTGSQYGVNDKLPFVIRLIEFVRAIHRADIKYAGICFGHQLLAVALGGQVEKSDNGWGIGLSFNQVIERRDWMTPYQSELNLIVSHQDQVVVLPEGAEVLASSKFCPYYLIQVGPHMMSVQGHPEFSKAYAAALMECRRDSIPLNRMREAMKSMSGDLHSCLMIKWIVNFFTLGFR